MKVKLKGLKLAFLFVGFWVLFVGMSWWNFDYICRHVMEKFRIHHFSHMHETYSLRIETKYWIFSSLIFFLVNCDVWQLTIDNDSSSQDSESGFWLWAFLGSFHGCCSVYFFIYVYDWRYGSLYSYFLKKSMII